MARNPNIERLYPLSPMQQGMLFHSLLEAGSGVYVTQLVFTLVDVNAAALRTAWEQVLRDHDVLRTSFAWQTQDNPLQVVRRDVELPWQELDWRDVDPAERREKLDVLLRADRARGFDLRAAPLMRLMLIRSDEHRYELVWSHHHLLLDGWSVAIVGKEVATIYQALVQGREHRPVLPRPYQDYIAWLQRQDRAKAEAFWRRSMQGFSAPTSLTVERSGRDDARHQDTTEEQWHDWSAPASAALKAFASQQNLTLSTVFHGAWAILLSRYSGEDDVLFGSVASGRPADLAGAESMVGLFINTLAVRTNVPHDWSAIAWLTSLQDHLLELRGYEHTSLVDVQGWSAVPRDRPLFETLLAFENYPVDPALMHDKNSLNIDEVRVVEQLDTPLSVAVMSGETLRVRALYNARRFDRETISRLLGHLEVILQAMVTDADCAIGRLPLLTASERQQVLEEWNPRGVSYPADASLHGLFEAAVERFPDAVAVSFGDERLTYRELNVRANRLAHCLRARGVGRDVLVGLCLDRGLDLIVGLVGILKAGGAYVPVDVAYPQDRIAFMLSDAEVAVIVTDRSRAATLPAHGAETVLVEAAELAGWPSENPATVSSAKDLAYVIFTSGSTGKPKGALITHDNVVRLFRATQAWFAFDERDVWTLFHSPAFDFSVWEIWGALLYGGRLVVAPYLVSRSPEAFRALLVQEQVTVLNQTPSAFNQLIQADAAAADDLSLRYVVFGGEALNMRDLAPWFERYGDERPRLINMYGITETTVHVTYRPLRRSDVAGGSVVGIPIPDLQVYILNGQLEPVPVGVAGEMFVGGAGLARGYLKRPELTAERFIANPFSADPQARLYRSGDLARFLPNREIEYLGRIDHQVKIRGFRIELGEIEAALKQHAGVRDAAVVVREDVPGDKRLVAYVVGYEGDASNWSALREQLKRMLPDYMVPAAYVSLPALPLTHNGKLDRKALPAPEFDAAVSDSTYVAPRTPVEAALATILCDVLKRDRVGIQDSFFELGGHSLLATRFISRIRQALGTVLSMQALFENPTIEGIARILLTRSDAKAEIERRAEIWLRVAALSGAELEAATSTQA
jgi:amino acid adenylation domain-containing protein